MKCGGRERESLLKFQPVSAKCRRRRRRRRMHLIIWEALWMRLLRDPMRRPLEYLLSSARGTMTSFWFREAKCLYMLNCWGEKRRRRRLPHQANANAIRKLTSSYDAAPPPWPPLYSLSAPDTHCHDAHLNILVLFFLFIVVIKCD